MRALMLVCLAALPFQDAAEDQYQYIAGLAAKGLHDRVAKEAERFLADHPRHARADLARYRLAGALFELHQNDAAARHLRELEKLRGFEFEAEAAFRLGQCELALERCEPAAQAFERALATRKDYLVVPAHALLAEARLRCNDAAGAEAHFRAVLEADPQGTYAADAVCGLAWCAHRRGDREQALAACERAVQKLGRHERAAEMRFLAGECLLDLERPRDALAAYRSVDGGAFVEGAARGAAFALAEMGDHAGAAAAFAQFVDAHPQSRFAPECRLQAGIEALLGGDADGALERLRAADLPPGGALDYWRARALSETGDKQGALKAADRALAAKPSEDLAGRLQVLRGDLLSALGRREDALDAYQRAGSDGALQRAIADSLAAKRPEEARTLARTLLERYPQSSHRRDAETAIAEAAFALGSYDDAQRSFAALESSARTQDERRTLRTRIAWCRYLSGDAANAAATFREIARAGDGPLVDEARFMEARALEAAGDKDGALRAYDAYLARTKAGTRRDEAVLRAAKLAPDGAARERLLAVLRDSPDTPLAADIHFELAERASAAHRLTEAAEHYRAAVSGTTNDELRRSATYGLAWCAYSEGRLDEAAQALRPLVAERELEAELRGAALELLLWVESKRGDPQAIETAWKAFAAAVPDETRLAQAARGTVAALKKAGEPDRAATLLGALARGARTGPLAALIAIERAYMLLDVKDVDGAQRELARAAEIAPADPALAEACFFLAEARFDAGEWDHAAALYDAALSIPENPVRDRALYKLGYARVRANDWPAAAAAFERLVAEHPKSELVIESRFLLGEAQYRGGAYDAAYATLKDVLATAPKHAVRPKALFRFGLAAGRLERWKESAEALTTLAREAPQFENLAESELGRGRALAALGDVRGARTALARVLDLDRGDLSGEAQLALGDLAARAGDHDAALSAYLKVAVLYDSAELVSRALLAAGGALEAQGDARRAAEQYREIVEKHAKTASADGARERLRALGAR
ncbi:MAG: tetratricopeptide repeat protein [Planctomycetota bacterium]